MTAPVMGSAPWLAHDTDGLGVERSRIILANTVDPSGLSVVWRTST